MKIMFLLFIALLLSGCAFITPKAVGRSSSLAQDEVRAEFLANPGCPTAYSLVGQEGATAIPLILETMDQFSGETNVPTRCEIIQGALWRPEIRTNAHFRPIIRRGVNDPSARVRAKTRSMVDIANKHKADGD